MVFNYALKAFSIVPKWVLILVAACGLTYMVGKSHGRAPYKLAEQLQTQNLVIAANSKRKNSSIEKQEKIAIEKSKDYSCTVDDSLAGFLSNVR